MKKMIKEAKELYVHKINKEPSQMGDQYKVRQYIVRIFKKPGRTLMTCTCYHGTKYCNSPTICKHKLAVLNFIMKNEKK